MTHETYKEQVKVDEDLSPKGLKTIVFPSNQFSNKESGGDVEIKEWVKSNFGANFLMMSKINVNGPDANPVYCWLRRNSSYWNGTQGKLIEWNLIKFVLDKEGKVIKEFDMLTYPSEIHEFLEGLLQET